MTRPDDRIELDAARDALASARAIVVLTGSGVSAESRIPTFRTSPPSRDHDQSDDDTMQALWAEFDPQALATPEAFEADPETVTRWYDWRRCKCIDAEPNPGHRALAGLQQRAMSEGRRFTMLTQNVDGLHQRAGSVGVVELHGSIMRWRGVQTATPAEVPRGPFESFPPTLETGEIIRPAVVWFGETLPPDAIEAASAALDACDLFLSIGTSSVVYPAAGFIHTAKANGATTIEINPEDTPNSGITDIALRGKAGEVLPRLL